MNLYFFNAFMDGWWLGGFLSYSIAFGFSTIYIISSTRNKYFVHLIKEDF